MNTKKTRLLLYNVLHKEDMPNEIFVPLAYILLEEHIKKYAPEIEVVRYDYIPNDPDSQELNDYFKYDIVGLQLTFPNANIVINLLEKWEKAGSKPLIVLGGVFASAIAMELIKKYHSIDIIVIAEGENPLLKITKYVEGEIKINDIPGIVYKNEDGEAIYNSGNKPIDFDLAPIPKWDLLSSIPSNTIKKTSIRIQTARGCMGCCSFCNNSYKNRLDKISTKVWRGMSPERLIQEIEYLYHKFGARLFNFVDPSFEDPGKKGKNRIKKIADMLIEKDLRISFKVNMRTETFSDDDLDLLYLLKKAGMDVIILGIEACNNDDLKLFGKNADIETSTRAYWRLTKMDCFFILIGYITFHPYATLNSLKQSFDYLHKINRSFSFLSFRSALIPLRGTSIYDKMLNDGLILNHDDILEVAQYKFIDDRVSWLNKCVQDLKVNYPILTQLNKRIHDSLNIIARSKNRIFEKLIDNKQMNSSFNQLKNNISEICEQSGTTYYEFQKEIIGMAHTSMNNEEFHKLAKDTIIKKAYNLFKQTDNEINKYVQKIKDNGFDATIMEFKTWGAYYQERKKVGV